MYTLNWSEVANIILTLFLLFQWYRDRAREEAIRNYILAGRRMVMRGSDSMAVIDALDATLSTLGSRKPFLEWGDGVLKFLHIRSSEEKVAGLSSLSNLKLNRIDDTILSPFQVQSKDVDSK